MKNVVQNFSKLINGILLVITSLGIWILWVFLIISREVMQPDFLVPFYVNKEKLSEKLNVTATALSNYVTGLLSYVRTGEGVDTIRMVTRDYTTISLTAREVSHMTDVHLLWRGICQVALVLGIITAVCVIYLICTKRFKRLLKVFLWTGFGLLLCGILAGCFTGWNLMTVTDKLHWLVFDNTTWILNPSYEKLVLFFSSGFYEYIFWYSLVRLCFLGGLVSVILLVSGKIQRNSRA